MMTYLHVLDQPVDALTLDRMSQPERRHHRRSASSNGSSSRYDTNNLTYILRESADEYRDVLERFQQARRTMQDQREADAGSNATPSNTPPASREAIARLPRSRILPSDKAAFKHDGTACGVCCEPLVEGVILMRMPCGHIYHCQCLVSWLSRSCTCPECRYELPTADVKYEIGRVARMKNRKVAACSCHPLNHTCFFADPSKSILDQCTIIDPEASTAPALGADLERRTFVNSQA